MHGIPATQPRFPWLTLQVWEYREEPVACRHSTPPFPKHLHRADSKWRNRDEFFEGRDAIEAFLTKKWEKELQYKLMKELWCYQGNRISVRFEYEYHDHSGQWWRAHGNEVGQHRLLGVHGAYSWPNCKAQHVCCTLRRGLQAPTHNVSPRNQASGCSKHSMLFMVHTCLNACIAMQHWEFNDQGYMVTRDMSANDYKIQQTERRYK